MYKLSYRRVNSCSRGSLANLRHSSLQLLSKIFEDDVTEDARHHSDDQIRQRKNIFDGKRKTLAVAIGPSELPHQKVGVKQKNDKSDLNGDFPFPLQFFWLIGVHWHSATIANTYCAPTPNGHAAAISSKTSADNPVRKGGPVARKHFQPYKVIIETLLDPYAGPRSFPMARPLHRVGPWVQSKIACFISSGSSFRF